MMSKCDEVVYWGLAATFGGYSTLLVRSTGAAAFPCAAMGCVCSDCGEAVLACERDGD